MNCIFFEPPCLMGAARHVQMVRIYSYTCTLIIQLYYLIFSKLHNMHIYGFTTHCSVFKWCSQIMLYNICTPTSNIILIWMLVCFKWAFIMHTHIIHVSIGGKYCITSWFLVIKLLLYWLDVFLYFVFRSMQNHNSSKKIDNTVWSRNLYTCSFQYFYAYINFVLLFGFNKHLCVYCLTIYPYFNIGFDGKVHTTKW